MCSNQSTAAVRPPVLQASPPAPLASLFSFSRLVYAACSGVLGRRGYAGARVTTNVMLRDLDLFLLQGPDGRRLEVVADGLPCLMECNLLSTPRK